MPFFNDVEGIAADAYLSPCLQLTDDLFGTGSGVVLPTPGTYWSLKAGTTLDLSSATMAISKQLSLCQEVSHSFRLTNLHYTCQI